MTTKHKGSPPNDPSSAPESGTVRDQGEQEPQYKRPAKRKQTNPTKQQAAGSEEQSRQHR